MWILLDIQIEKDLFSWDLLTLAHIYIDVNIVLKTLLTLKEKANQLCGQFNRMYSQKPKSMSARGNRTSSLIGKIGKTQFNCIVWIEILLISGSTACCLKIYHLSLSSWIFMYQCFLLTYGNRRNQQVHLSICCRKWKIHFQASQWPAILANVAKTQILGQRQTNLLKRRI